MPEPGRKVFKLSANETPFGPSPKAIAAYKGAARSSGGLSGRHLAGTARSDRPRLWARSRPHHLRRRLRRNPQSAGAHLSPPWRRGDLHRARFSGLSDRDHGEQRQQCGRARDRLHRQCRCDPEAGVSRAPSWSGSPTRTTRPGPICRSTRSSACAPDCRRKCCWCSTPPIPITCRATTTSSASNWWRPPRTP